ncbi:MAG TPA: CoA pyrophosphatase [Gemmatimonadaceae bacterium]|nr:CoA pyrophosphatase [Gemmatimonadaceae bacterium]
MTLAQLAERLANHCPERVAERERLAAAGSRAAVAVVVREQANGASGGALELLLIKRAEHERDPWSGHVALPGGREEAADRTLEDTAIRETLEETGLDLRRDGQILGALDELHPRSAPVPILVRPYVASVRADAPLTLSDEVAAAFWVPLSTLTAPGASVESTVAVRGAARQVPSYRHGEYVVWGMTERILRNLVYLVGD